MKTSIILFVVSMLSVTLARADETAYLNILKERDAVLSELLANQEGRYERGVAGQGDVDSARLALLAFRRDTAKLNTEKIKNQEAIVGIYEKRLASLKMRRSQGTVGGEEILIFTDTLLQAKQLLEELKLKEDRG